MIYNYIIVNFANTLLLAQRLLGGRYLLSSSVTLGSLTVDANAELVLADNLEIQTKAILVKGPPIASLC